MNYNVVGIRLSRGNFTNRETGESFDYNNVVFNVTYPSLDDHTVGDSVSEIKIKRSLLTESDLELRSLVGKKVIFDTVPGAGGRVNYCGFSVVE